MQMRELYSLSSVRLFSRILEEKFMKKKYSITILIAMLLSMTAEASVKKINVENNYSSDMIMVSGVSDSNEIVSIQILPKNIKLSELENDPQLGSGVVYNNETVAEEDGKFSFDIQIDNSGEYLLYMATNDKQSQILSKNIFYLTSTEYKNLVDYINGASTEDEYIQRMTEKKQYFGDITTDISFEKIAKKMYDEGKLENDYVNNFNKYKNCIAILQLNDNNTQNAEMLIENIIMSDKTDMNNWDKFVQNSEKKQYFISKLANRNITDISDLKLKIKKALILTAVKYPDGYMNIQSICNEYKQLLNKSSITDNKNVYSKLAGSDFKDIDEFIREYDKLLSNSTSSNGGASSSSGGGTKHSNKISNSGGYSTVITEGQSVSGISALKLKFTDLRETHWAYKSVSVLYEANIISGVTETEFEPSREIKREEFAKMLISAMGLEINNEENIFADVEPGAWYAGFVNTAYKNGIVNGISDEKFGVGESIKRQDMAVMIYNAMKKRGFLAEKKEITFADSGDIAEYAKEAVAALYDINVINGVGDNSFAPCQTATRAQAAVIIERALKYIN